MLPKTSILRLDTKVNDVIYHKKVDTFFSITQRGTIFKIDSKTHKVVSLNSHHQTEKYHPNVTVGSKKGIIHLRDDNLNSSVLYDIVQDKVITTLKHQKNIKHATISPNGQRLLISDLNGLCTVYNLKTYEEVGILPAVGDLVSATSFSKDSRYIAICYFNKRVSIYNLIEMSEVANFQTNNICYGVSFTPTNNAVVTLDREGCSSSYSLINHQITQNQFIFEGWINNLLLFSDTKAIATTRTGMIYGIDLEQNTQLFKEALGFVEPSIIKLVQEYLMIGFAGGELLIMRHLEFQEQLEEAIKLDDVTKITSTFSKNPLLEVCMHIDPLQELWEQKYRAIIVQKITHQKTQEAKKLAAPFLKNKKRIDEFQQLLGNEEEFKLLDHYLQTERYAEILNHVGEDATLQMSSAYKVALTQWSSIYKKTMRAIARHNVSLYNLYLSQLRIYEKVSALLPLITNIQNHEDTFAKATMHIERREFQDYFELCDEHEYLKYTIEHKKIIQLGEKLAQALIDYESEEEFNKVDQVVGILQHFPKQYKLMLETTSRIQLKKSFLQAYRNKNYKESYQLSKKLNNDYSFQSLQTFLKELVHMKQKATKASKTGNVAALLTRVTPYKEIQELQDFIHQSLQTAYLHQLTIEFAHHEGDEERSSSSFDIQLSVQHYLNLFGLDDAIIAFCTNNSLDYNTLSTTPQETQEFPQTILVQA
jgi:hypothetical protein